jgi:hypothetical protein
VWFCPPSLGAVTSLGVSLQGVRCHVFLPLCVPHRVVRLLHHSHSSLQAPSQRAPARPSCQVPGLKKVTTMAITASSSNSHQAVCSYTMIVNIQPTVPGLTSQQTLPRPSCTVPGSQKHVDDG